MIVVSASLANHLGLVEAIEDVVKCRIPILNCSKCCSFWCVLCYMMLVGQSVITSVAVSFLCAYAAIWLELVYGYIDTLYNRWYEKIYTENAEADADTESTVSKLWKR